MSIEDDRWFKLKVDNWVKSAGNIDRTWANPFPSVTQHYSEPRPWYEHDFLYSQIAEQLAVGSKYTPAEVEEHLRTLVSSAKLEAILDDH